MDEFEIWPDPTTELAALKRLKKLMFPFFLSLYNGSQVSIVALWATCLIIILIFQDFRDSLSNHVDIFQDCKDLIILHLGYLDYSSYIINIRFYGLEEQSHFNVKNIVFYVSKRDVWKAPVTC